MKGDNDEQSNLRQSSFAWPSMKPNVVLRDMSIRDTNDMYLQVAVKPMEGTPPRQSEVKASLRQTESKKTQNDQIAEEQDSDEAEEIQFKTEHSDDEK